jgi:predicted nucleic acid-binding Zn ribbon protein
MAKRIFPSGDSSETKNLMATYIYETVPKNSKTKPRRFEVEQKMSDPPLKTDPETGLPVRRVIVGGSGVVTHGASILSMNTKRSRR